MESIGPLYLSQHRVKHNGVTLLDYGGLLLGDIGVKITPSRMVQAVSGPGWSAGGTYDRGNRTHQVSFTLVRQFASVWLAMMDQLNFTKNLPTGGADTTIEIQYASAGLTLARSTITAAPAGVQGIRFSVFQITIQGGALTGDDMAIAGILDEDGGQITDEDGGQIIAG